MKNFNSIIIMLAIGIMPIVSQSNVLDLFTRVIPINSPISHSNSGYNLCASSELLPLNLKQNVVRYDQGGEITETVRIEGANEVCDELAFLLDYGTLNCVDSINHQGVTGTTISMNKGSSYAQIDVLEVISSSSNGCCDNVIICGDDFDNIPSRIKHYDGFTYFIGSTVSNGETVAAFTKIDSDKVLIWEYQLDQPSLLSDFVKTDDGGFLLVGKTLPAQSNNLSILARINDDDGSADFIRSYQNVGREGLIRIIKHHNPLNANFPYYMVGVENPGPAVSYDDEIHLHNVNAQGDLNWSLELDDKPDDQWARGLLPLQNGNIALFGDYVPGSKGVVVTVDGLDGTILQSVESSVEASYQEAVELSNGDIAIAGKIGVNSSAFLTLLDSDLNFISCVSIDNQVISTFTELKKNSNDELFSVGLTNSGVPIICKAEINAGQVNITDYKYYMDGESSITTPTIDVVGQTLYYADGRADHPLSFGGQDVLVGYFDADLSDNCLIDTTFLSSSQLYSMTTIFPTSTSFTAPTPIQNITLVDQNFNCVSVDIEELNLDLGPNILKCNTEELTLHAGTGFESYLWNDFTTDSIYSTIEEGIHYVEAIDQCGRVYRDTVLVTIDESNDIDLGEDISLCYLQDTVLTILGDFDEVLWYPSELVSCSTCLSTDVMVEDLATLIVQGIHGNCISYDTIEIVRIIPEFDTITMASCVGETVDFFGQSISTSGTYENLSSNCLHLDVLEIHFTTADTTQLMEVICSSDSVLFDGQYLTVEGVYKLDIYNSLGCDSTVILDLVVLNEVMDFDTLYICENDSILVFGEWIYTDAELQSTFISNSGCDSIQSTTVIMYSMPTDNKQFQICQGDSIYLYGHWYANAGFFQSQVVVDSGCDSLISLEIVIKENFSNFDTITACYGDTVHLFSQLIMEDKDVWEFYTAENGCDSLSYFHVNFVEELTSSEEFQLCPGDSILINGNWINEEGMFETIYTSYIGCDSIHSTYISVVPESPNPEIEIDCEDLVISVSVDPQTQWQPLWSNGDTTYESYFYGGGQEISLKLTSQPNCEKELVITLPQLPVLADLVNIPDTTIGQGEIILIDLELDPTEWSVLWNESYIVNCDTCIQVEIAATEDTEITIYFEHQSGCTYEFTFVIRVEKEEDEIYIPNIFSPNSDNTNDEWILFAKENIEIITCNVYDRWGNLVYASTETDPTWDGKFNGKNCQQGLYAYIIEYIDLVGQHQMKTGDLTITR